MSASQLPKSEVRIQQSLDKNEEDFRAGRRETAHTCLLKNGINCSADEVPNIALLGSGGGERAMVGLLGSLVQLDKVGILDTILYLSGVSGSTWCMASLYQEPDWSTKLEAVKDKIIQRLSGPAVSWTDALAKLKKYYQEKDIFSLTDFWAAMVVTTYVKEIDEKTLKGDWEQHDKDPYPIYTVIDKQSKQQEEKDPWFEFTPHEAGYSLIGAFLRDSNFGNQFAKGSVIKAQSEIDMLYLQGLCGSALADGVEIRKFLWQTIKDFIHRLIPWWLEEKGKEDPASTSIDKCLQVLLKLVEVNLCVLDGTEPNALVESIATALTDLAPGKTNVVFPVLDLTDKEATKLQLENFTILVCNELSNRFSFWPIRLCSSIWICMVKWIWGRQHNFLYNMTVSNEVVPAALLKSNTRDYEDAGLLLNSPYFSVLRQDRDIDIIISLDFSDGDPFKTVKDAATMCKDRKIPFPEVKIQDDFKKPKDFYVFKGPNVPTVIHIPLFNVVNCGDKIEAWKSKYVTFQPPYSADMITDLMDVAGKNITNNKKKLVEVIHANILAKR